DTVIRSDTPYHIHNRGQSRRVAAIDGATGAAALTVGTRYDLGEDHQWILEPAGGSRYHIRSVLDGRLLSESNGTPVLVPAELEGPSTIFSLTQSQYGWFYLTHAATGQRLRSTPSLTFAPGSRTNNDTQWRFIPVFEGPPGPPRALTASASINSVELNWADHGFRDLTGFRVSRAIGNAAPIVIASDITVSSYTDTDFIVGSATYSVTALGDTGESLPSDSVAVCLLDIDNDKVVSASDITAAASVVDSDDSLNYLDLVTFFDAIEAGCP
ncbi:MAG: hypothetical protein AAF747_02130, partial [Planctomycetota bacterium]